MKKLCILTAIVLLAIAITEGFCSPVLISVELPTRESKKAWHRLNIPTYELIGNTAIAEAEESQIGSFAQKGYLIKIIDRQPEVTKYMIISKAGKVKTPVEKPIWMNESIALAKQESNEIFKQKEFNHQVRLFNTKPLGERFWKNITTKYVPLKSIPYDPFIQSLVDQVNADSVASYIQRLQDFKTRLAFSDSSYYVSKWIYDKFNSYEYSIDYDSFYVNQTLWNSWPDTGYERNVIASINGDINPNKLFIVGGHFDAIIFPDTSLSWLEAPGADDNASGMAGVIELSRIFKGQTWESSLIFAGWSCEELGKTGSEHYAETAESLNVSINGVINMDMIGFMNDLLIDAKIWNHGELDNWLASTYFRVAQTYVPSLLLTPELRTTGSDEIFFSSIGYPAICIIEKEFNDNPNYHTINDKIGTLNPLIYSNIIKATAATMAVLNIYPGPVMDVVAQDSGDGANLLIKWSANTETDITGYKLYYGLNSEAYTDTHSIAGISNVIDTLKGLCSDSTYYITVNAVDYDGHESYVATEIIGSPRVMPLVPDKLQAIPLINGISVSWCQNKELDIAGYIVYRKTNSGTFDSIGSLKDTVFIDSSLAGSNKYYYKVSSFDTDGNFSPLSDSVYCRPITLDQGVLLVDETNNWTTGSFPRDAQQDSFYDYIMAGYKYEQYEYGASVQKPVLADFGPYSTVVWFADDYTTMLASGAVNDLKDYLGAGGKLWYAGWKPSGNIHNTTSYPADYTSGDVSYDQFKITHAELSGAADSFQAAIGLRGYPDIAIDTLKYPGSTLWGKTMRYIETLTPLAGADTIYVMGMKNEGSPFEGRACAVRDSGKTVFFGFPMYFMDKEQAKLAAEKLMAEFGEEPLGVAEKPETENRTMQFRLDQNAPNPFNKQTTIRYQLPKAVVVQLNIYNIAGQLVKTFDEGRKPAGDHQINWKDNLLPNGIYFYRLQAGDLVSTKRLLIIR